MPEFRQPIDLPETPEYYDDKSIPEMLANLARNYNELVQDYNRLLTNLDQEVFYHIVPMLDGDVETTGTFTQTDRVIVVIDGTQYYLSLDAV